MQQRQGRTGAAPWRSWPQIRQRRGNADADGTGGVTGSAAAAAGPIAVMPLPERFPPFFHYANALKYLASAAAAVAILNGNRAEAMTLQWSVLVLIGFKWLAVAAGLGGRAVP